MQGELLSPLGKQKNSIAQQQLMMHIARVGSVSLGRASIWQTVMLTCLRHVTL